ncbi:orotidine 5'-phosphate decarboxylase, partial [Candidatus Gottesmanbacteria bacterium CG_4_10_14_0_8_um_filter_37_24]
MNFQSKISEISTENNSLLCIGLDSDINKIPFHIKGTDNPQYNFNKAIIEATHDLVCAYKPNSAFYE